MDLRDYLRVVRKGWALILGFVALGIAGGVALTIATTKVYQADAQLIVAISGAQDQSQLAQGSSYITQQVQSFTSIANAPAVINPVRRQLGLTNAYSEQDLAAKVTADAPLNKVLINLHVTDNDPKTAARLANAVAAQYTKVVEATQPNANGQQLVKLTVIQPAVVPDAPIKPNKVLNLGLGLVLGLLLGIGLAVLREMLDTSIKGPQDLEELGVPVLTNVPLDKRTQRSPIAFRADAHGPRAEAYRTLRTNLQFVDVDNPPRIIAVTSALPGEGKSTTALNLAAALAEAGSRVCLLEADLRRPSIAKAVGIVGEVGFTTVLVGRAPVDSVLQSLGTNLTVMTSGAVPPNPSELLGSRHAREVIEQLSSEFDFVVVDTPPLLPVTDGAQLATIVDATLLVHRVGKTTRDQLIRSVSALEKVGRRPVGVILNMLNRSRGGTYVYEYGYYYAEYRPQTSGEGPDPTSDETALIPAQDGSRNRHHRHAQRHVDSDEHASTGASADR